jgi:hypothetical protein
VIATLVTTTVLMLAPGGHATMDCPPVGGGYNFAVSSGGHLLRAREDRGALDFGRAIVQTFAGSLDVQNVGRSVVRVRLTCGES